MKKKLSQSEAGKLGAIASKPIIKKLKNKRISIYLSNPSKCKVCLLPLPYEKRRNIYCGHSCSASHSNKIRGPHSNFRKTKASYIFCQACKSQTTNPKYCSSQCHRNYEWEQYKKRILSGDPTVSDKRLKEFIIENNNGACQICHITTWTDKPVPLVLDHINGNPEDSSLANLRVICHNCNALTPTFAGRNRGNGRHYRRQRYAQGQSY